MAEKVGGAAYKMVSEKGGAAEINMEIKEALLQLYSG